MRLALLKQDFGSCEPVLTPRTKISNPVFGLGSHRPSTSCAALHSASRVSAATTAGLERYAIRNGIDRRRFPVALAMAFASAGKNGGTAGSPRPGVGWGSFVAP